MEEYKLPVLTVINTGLLSQGSPHLVKSDMTSLSLDFRKK
jgi:hypothetical protein